MTDMDVRERLREMTHEAAFDATNAFVADLGFLGVGLDIANELTRSLLGAWSATPDTIDDLPLSIERERDT